MTDQYVTEALRQIDLAGDLHGLTLREVSRRLGCAHTNAYNYFEDLPALLWRARAAALERQIEAASTPLQRRRSPRAAFEACVASQVDFALQHPGWYRAIWLDRLEGPPPADVVRLLERATEVILELVSLLAPGELPPARAREVAEVFHTYLHGALCKAIAGRVASAAPADLRRSIVSTARRVLLLLLAEGPRRGKRA